MSQVPTHSSKTSEVKEAKTSETIMEKAKIENISEASGSEYERREAVDDEPAVEFFVPMSFNIIRAPKVCPPGYRMDSTGKCRRIM